MLSNAVSSLLSPSSLSTRVRGLHVLWCHSCHRSLFVAAIIIQKNKIALGAIDGTHIHANVLKSKHPRYHNRKGDITQNVMACVSFDLQFMYVAAGWEGSTVDMRVLRWALEEGGFSVPKVRNFIRREQVNDCYFEQKIQDVENDYGDTSVDASVILGPEITRGDTLRNLICSELWARHHSNQAMDVDI